MQCCKILQIIQLQTTTAPVGDRNVFWECKILILPNLIIFPKFQLNFAETLLNFAQVSLKPNQICPNLISFAQKIFSRRCSCIPSSYVTDDNPWISVKYPWMTLKVIFIWRCLPTNQLQNLSLRRTYELTVMNFLIVSQRQESGLTSPRISSTLSTESGVSQEKSSLGRNLSASQMPFTYSQVELCVTFFQWRLSLSKE